MSLIGCPETSAMNYRYLLRNSTEARSFSSLLLLQPMQNKFDLKH